MTVGLEDQIRDYANNVHQAEMPLTVAEITEIRLGTDTVRPIGQRTQSANLRPRVPWLVAVASAATVLLLAGGVAWLTQVPGSDSPAATAAVSTTVADTDVAAQREGVTVSVTGNLLDAHYWEAPTLGPDAVGEGRMVLSDERISGNVTFTANGEILKSLDREDSGQYLYWGTMVIENDGGTWEGTHFAADHRALSGAHAPIVMQLVGHGGYEGFSAILYRTVISDVPGHVSSVDGMIFPGNLPPDRD